MFADRNRNREEEEEKNTLKSKRTENKDEKLSWKEEEGFCCSIPAQKYRFSFKLCEKKIRFLKFVSLHFFFLIDALSFIKVCVVLI